METKKNPMECTEDTEKTPYEPMSVDTPNPAYYGKVPVTMTAEGISMAAYQKMQSSAGKAKIFCPSCGKYVVNGNYCSECGCRLPE